jgi:hypothetical protein
MRLLELIAYHGSPSSDPQFAYSRMGDVGTTFGNFQTNRVGSFFSNNPEFAAMYGDVKQYDLNVHNTATDLRNIAFNFQMELDAHDPVQRPIWIHVSGITRSTGNDLWELFDDDLGEMFVPWLIKQGYDSAQFEEWGETDQGEEVESLNTVVFDPKNIKQMAVNESFFSDNHDILMPVVRGLMKTAARPLIYKLWKKSPNAVLALAAIKKLKDQGDENPIDTIMTLSNLDVPTQFMKRLAYDTGVFDIGGVVRGHKPDIMPVVRGDESGDDV